MRRVARVGKVLLLAMCGAWAYDMMMIAGLDDQAFEAHLRDLRERRAKLRGKGQQPRQRSF